MNNAEEVIFGELEEKLSDRVARRKELDSLIVATSANIQTLSLKTTELNRFMRSPRLVRRRKSFKKDLFLAVDEMSRGGTILAAQKRVLEVEEAAIVNLGEELYHRRLLSKPEGGHESRLSMILGDDFTVTRHGSGVRVAPLPQRYNSIHRSKTIDELLVDTSVAEELYTAFDSLGYWISREIISGPAGVASFFKVVLETAQEFRLAVLLANPSSQT